jgi:superfamily II DNA or RNA helicase
MKEKEWFSRGIALSEPCNKTIVDNSLQRLEQLRETGTAHQIIAVACTVDLLRARSSGCTRRAGSRRILSSAKWMRTRRSRSNAGLRAGNSTVIVQVQMLGEGFDIPS